ncbi:hypothetical protein HNQ51_000368 [Inhella inkyongensis]|uniref:DUF3667 domain-containing protein n=1 Tax=Inhella inkyongensis TaxID=392593 RepID=A0A840RYN0_9BURK|nr:DUF3667 domain-containing protein [Inhella inkyongensis]MBB5203075.1 hypothetical protein [Inhella inkyongensis]
MTASTSNTCANCGHRLAPWDKFCAQCGQDTANHPPSLWEFVHEFLLHYVAFEGKLWKSLWGLLAKPGFLTTEYLAGRKQRYVLPLRLILTLGLVFFLVIKAEPGDNLLVLDPPAKAAQRGPQSAASAAAARLDPVAQAKEKAKADYEADRQKEQEEPTGPSDDEQFEKLTQQLPVPMASALKRSQARFKADSNAEMKRVAARMLALAPYAVLCSLPFYAGLLALLYRSRRQPFGAHFVFAMHLHAAWYAVLLVGQLPGWVFTTFAVFWANAYPVLALKRVYAGAWWSTVLRALLLLLLHLLLLLMGLVVLGLVGALG